MIVLGPMDADLNGAPAYWRQGNWRPNTGRDILSVLAAPTCPFDRCDMVLEYDARFEGKPLPADQGWIFKGDDQDEWIHDDTRGVLRFRLNTPSPSFWLQEIRHDPIPDRAVSYGAFIIDEESKTSGRLGGFDFTALVSPTEGRSRGVRGGWKSGWRYRVLDSLDVIPVVQPAAEPTMQGVWHTMALDAELVGPNVRGENVEPRDGGKTICSFDGLVNYDDRRAFGYSAEGASLALFGKWDATAAEPDGRLEGWLRTFCTSFPGRFLRAGFRAVALGKITRLRLVFYVEAGEQFEPGSIAVLVRYTTPGTGLRAGRLPTKEAPRAVQKFESEDVQRTVEVSVNLEGLTYGEELWFTIERDWQHEADTLRSTAHLLMVVVEEGGE